MACFKQFCKVFCAEAALPFCVGRMFCSPKRETVAGMTCRCGKICWGRQQALLAKAVDNASLARSKLMKITLCTMHFARDTKISRCVPQLLLSAEMRMANGAESDKCRTVCFRTRPLRTKGRRRRLRAVLAGNILAKMLAAETALQFLR